MLSTRITKNNRRASIEKKHTHKIALLFNANKVYDRQIITGIGDYLKSTRNVWDLFLEEDFRCRLDGIERWSGDGIIADFDDPDVCAALASTSLPVVAIGGSYKNPADYPPDIPYVATDNFKLVKMAYDHLIEHGLSQFACYSLPESPYNRWAQEREKAFRSLMEKDGISIDVHRGLSTSAPTWDIASEQLSAWLLALPKPVGIIAVTDARARHLLQTCLQIDIPVPEEVAIVGIDNDPLTQTLTRIPLSSVIQGTDEMGRTAARLLHQILMDRKIAKDPILIPPAGITIEASSRREMVFDHVVMRARHFIRQYAGQGIKVEQVAEYVGVSRSSLENRFLETLGYSVHREILNFRLEMAKSMLVEYKASNATIALRCGFSSLQYMYTVFRREVGCTPREYQIMRATATTGPLLSEPQKQNASCATSLRSQATVLS